MENEAEGGQQEGWGSLKVLKGIQRGSGLPIEETLGWGREQGRLVGGQGGGQGGEWGTGSRHRCS